MDIQPLAITYGAQTPPSRDALSKLTTAAVNGAMLFEQMLGATMSFRQAMHLHDPDPPNLSSMNRIFRPDVSRRVYQESTSVWWSVFRTLQKLGHPPHEAIYLVWLPGTAVTDGTGVAQQINVDGRVYWNEHSDPQAGGIAVMGWRAIHRTLSAPPSRWTDLDRVKAVIDRKITAHEMGHALGRHHRDDVGGDPWEDVHVSIMRYGYAMWASGFHGTDRANPLLATAAERDTWRRHVLFTPYVERLRNASKIVHPEAVELGLDGRVPWPETMLFGPTVQDLVAFATA